MSTKRVLIGALLLAVIAATLFVWRPWRPARDVQVGEELGYRFEYEIPPGGLHILQSNPDRDGREYVGLVVQGHYSVMIDDGNLTINREPRGRVHKGDQLRISLEKEVWVNGRRRK